ncbi:MAG: response regulator [Faecalibacterium prausnitzii]
MIRLLIADDEKLEREALAELVQRRFEREVVLEVAENGRKAADTAVLWGADLILMDIEMPGMSGLDAARAVLAQRPSCRVIFVTAYSLFQYAHEAVHLGACDYLLKPVDPDELEASVRRAMRQIETERKLEELAAAQPAGADGDRRRGGRRPRGGREQPDGPCHGSRPPLPRG